MTTRAWVFVFFLGLAACGPSGKLSGTVTVKGGTPGGVTVTLSGAVTKAAAVDDSGAYAFDGLPDGVYLIEATAPSTLEGSLTARGTVASGTGTVDPIAFRGAGAVSGRVTSPTGSDGAEVFVAGESLRVNTQQDGTFVLEKVPAGEATVVATREGYEPVYTKLTVPFGSTLENQVLALTEVAHGSGQIAGRAYFFDQPTHAGITVRVDGTAISAQTDAQGEYTLRGVPLGYVTLVAEAQGYQPARAVNVLSASGGTLRANDLRLSYAQRRFDGDVVSTALSPDGMNVLFVGRAVFEDAYSLYRLELSATAAPVRLQRVGTSARLVTAVWRADGKRAAFRYSSDDTLYALNLESNEVTQLTEKIYDSEIVLAGERLFFLARGANFTPVLGAYDFGTKQFTSIETVEPPTGACPYTWGAGRFSVSSAGIAAYFAKGANGSTEAHTWDGTVKSVSAGVALDCLEWHGKGTQLLGLRVQSGLALYNFTTGAPATLIPDNGSPYYSPQISFTGDDQHAWYIVIEQGVPTLRSIPIAGGLTSTLLTGTNFTPSQVAVQPGGDQLGFRGPNYEVIVKHANGTMAGTYPTPPSGLSSVAFGFGPEGKHFVVEYLSDRIVQLADASTHLAKPLGEATTWSTNLAFVLTFSPHERALAMNVRLPTGESQARIFRTAGAQALDLPFLGASVPASIWSATDRFVSIADPAGDRIVEVDTGAIHDLERSAKPFAYNAPFFTGDETRLVFSEDDYGVGPMMAAHTDDGSKTVIGDGDSQTYVLQIPGSARILAIDLSSAGEARGLYTIDVK